MSPMLWWYTCRLECARMYVYVILCVRVCMYMYVCFMYLNLYTHKYTHIWISTSTFWVCWWLPPMFMLVHVSPRVCAYVCVCHLLCEHMFIYGCMFNGSEFVYAWSQKPVNLNVHILSLLRNDSKFSKVYMSSSVCACVCVCLCVRVYVYVCVFYIVSFIRTHVHPYMDLKFKILGLLTNDFNFMVICMPSRVCARMCVCLCVYSANVCAYVCMFVCL